MFRGSNASRLIALALVLVGTTVVPTPAQRGSPVATAALETRSHVISVAGRLRPRSRIEHSIPTAGFIDEIRAQEGDRIQAGDTLVTVRRRDDALELYEPSPVMSRVTGRITEISVQEEQEVQAGERAAVILGTDGFLVEAVVSDKDAFRVTVGQSVPARTAEGTTLTATVASRSQEPDYETGLYDLVFEIAPTDEVRLGAFLVIELPIDRVEGVFVPRDAIVRRFGRDTVWTVTEDNELAAQPVELGAAFDDLVHVREGLNEGTRYIAAPTGDERDGRSLRTEQR